MLSNKAGAMIRLLTIVCCCLAAGEGDNDPLPFTVSAAVQESAYQIDVTGRADLPDRTILDVTVRRLTALPEENANPSNDKVEMRTMVRDGRFQIRVALDRSTAIPWEYEIRVACDPARQNERVRERWTSTEAIASRRSLWMGTSAEAREAMAAELNRLREISDGVRRLVDMPEADGEKAVALAADLGVRLAAGRERTFFREAWNHWSVVENDLTAFVAGQGPPPAPATADAPPDPSIPGAADAEVLGPAGSDPSKRRERRDAMGEHLAKAQRAVVREAGALVRQRIVEDATRFDEVGRAWASALARVMEGVKTSAPFAKPYAEIFVRADVDRCERLFAAFRKALDASGDEQTTVRKGFEEALREFEAAVGSVE